MLRSTMSAIAPCLSGVVLAATTSACAFIPVAVEPPAAQGLVQPSSIGRGREIVLTMPLTDARPDPRRCGTQKNGYGMETADVYCRLPPHLWMAQTLAQGLQASGFVVTTPPNGSPSAVHVNGEVQQFFLEPKMSGFTANPEADIAVRLVVTSASGLRAERRFYFKAEDEAALSTEEHFQAAADSATRLAVQGMALAIASLLDRYPGLGVPTPVAVAIGTEVAR